MLSWSKLSAEQRISVGRRRLIDKRTLFWGSLVLKMKPVEAAWLPTMAVDGKHLFYNVDFVMSLSHDELIGVLAHETMHNANLHSTRMGSRDPRKWNVACDYAINGLLKENGFTLPSSALISEKYKNWSAERVYANLPDNKMPKGGGGKKGKSGDGSDDGKGSGGQQDNDPGGCGGVISPRHEDGSPLTEQERVILERTIGSDVQAAIKAAKQMGTLPGGMEDMFPMPAEPKIDWRQILPRFIQSNSGIPHDSTWSKPNRRYVASGIYLPSMEHQNDAEIAVVIDTSGSIGPQEFAAFLGEINEITSVIRPKAVHVIQCDAAVADYECLDAGEPISATIKGRGGTSFVPPFVFLKERGIVPNCLVYFTDMYGDFPHPDLAPFPVLWASTTQGMEAPFGETTFVEI